MVNAPEMSSLKKDFDEYGYVVARILDDGDIDKFREAAESATKKTREGQWPHMRVVGKQFPPFGEGDDIWGVQNIMCPDLGEESALFRQVYCSDRLLDIVSTLGNLTKEQLRLGLFNMLVNPQYKDDFGLSWHRDTIKPSATVEEEQAVLNDFKTAVQWNIALYDDECLWAVPHSHNRLRTPEEREATMSPTGEVHMPGAIPVKLRPGEGVFYNNQILHRGTYTSRKKRATLHGAHGTVNDGETMVMGMLQHDLKWVLGDGVGNLFRGAAGDTGYNLWSRLKEASAQLDRDVVYVHDVDTKA